MNLLLLLLADWLILLQFLLDAFSTLSSVAGKSTKQRPKKNRRITNVVREQQRQQRKDEKVFCFWFLTHRILLKIGQ